MYKNRNELAEDKRENSNNNKKIKIECQPTIVERLKTIFFKRKVDEFTSVSELNLFSL